MTRNKITRVHSNTSQRPKPRNGGDRKVVFRGVLDNPHRIQWPSIPMNLQNSILARLVDLLDGVAEYHRQSCADAKKRKRLPGDDGGLRHHSKSRRIATGVIASEQKKLSESCTDVTTSFNSAKILQRPSVLDHLTYGINQVTKRLEKQIEEAQHKPVSISPSEAQVTGEKRPMIRYLLVCRADVDPPILVDHFLHLAATYNVLRKPSLPAIILSPLPKGAEATIAQAIGVRRIAVIAIDFDFPEAREHLRMADALPLVTAPWLSSPAAKSFVQAHIKQLRTTTPRDMKATKVARIQEKAAARKRRQLAQGKEAIRKVALVAD